MRNRALALFVLFGLASGALGIGLSPRPAAAAAPPIVERVYIPVAAGTPQQTTIAAWVVRPASSESRPVPALFRHTPYGATGNAGAEWAAQGYAYVDADVRGTGCSGGSYGIFSPREIRDGYDVVEWIARQPWATPRVGMTGTSYSGINQVLIAGLNPPHLTAIFAGGVFDDLYRDVAYPGGILNHGYSAQYTVGQRFLQARNGVVADAIRRRDTECVRNQVAGSEDTENPFLLGHATRPFDSDYYWERSPHTNAGKIKAATYLATAWQDRAVGSRAPALFEAIRAPKKLVIGRGAHDAMLKVPFVAQEKLRWYDYWLKGTGNGIMGEPAVHSLIGLPTTGGARRPDSILASRSWPPEQAKFKRWYLRAGAQLSDALPGVSEAPDVYVHPGGTQQVTAGSRKAGPVGSNQPVGRFLSYGRTLQKDVVVAGPMSLRLWVESTSPDFDVFVALNAIRPGGGFEFIQSGYLRASHRAVDASRSTSYRPYHWHDADHLAPLTPGTIVPLDVEIWPITHEFEAGTKLRLDILTPNPGIEQGGMTFTTIPAPSVVRIYHDKQHPSSLYIPIVGGG